MLKLITILVVFGVLITESFQASTPPTADVTLTVDEFGSHEGQKIERFTWQTPNGLSISVISYGAHVQSVKLPDNNGVTKDLVLGFDDLDSYVTRNTEYFGATVGRCANRIGNATFQIDGETYNLAKNNGNNSIHGGLVGFNKKVWEPTIDGTKVILTYLSKDGEENYPGDLLVNVTYQVTEDNSFHVQFTAQTTKKTVVSLINHSYFNLAGHDGGAERLYEHIVSINADRYTEKDSESIPTGKILEVEGTSYDLRSPTKLANLLTDELFDDNFCVSNYTTGELNFVARAIHPESGRYLEVYSDQPGVQFYTSNSLPSDDEPAFIGKGSTGYRIHQALCFETQKYPDAVNHENFPSAILSPGEVYQHKAVYKFGVESSG